MSSYTSYSSGLGEALLKIDEFRGIDQSRDDHNPDPSVAVDAQNFIARYGVLRTALGGYAYMGAIPETATGGRIMQAFVRDSTGVDKTYILAALGGKLYSCEPGGATWTQIGSGFTSDAWDYVNYRHEDAESIIMTNGVDTAQRWDGSTLTQMPVEQAQEDVVFSQITLLYERLWGAVTTANPDRIYWSESFNPDEWDLNYDDPENLGGGFIDVATFDGTRIRAIVAAFDDVLIFKDKSMHRLNGTYPGEFSLTNVYGTEGTLAPRTICVTSDRLYFLAAEGLCAYDGMSVVALADAGDRRLKNVWARLNLASIDKACSMIHDGVMYIAVPLDEAARNSHVVEYHMETGTYSLITLANVDDFLLLREGQKERLLYLSGNQIYEYEKAYNFYGEDINAYWLSPEIDCGSLAKKKRTGRVYMRVYAQSLDYGRAPEIKLSMISGDKIRTRTIELENGVNYLRTRVRIRGRTFRYKIENTHGDPMQIYGGMEIHIEEDYD